MSQENVEVVREGFAHWNRGDYGFFLDLAAPDIELFSRFATLTGEPYRGHAGMREWIVEIQHNFERFELWLDEVRDLGDEVLAIGGVHLQARGSGIDMRQRMGWVLEFSRRPRDADAVLRPAGRSPRSRGTVGVGGVAAGDRVVALIDQRMRGRSTGIEVPFGKYAGPRGQTKARNSSPQTNTSPRTIRHMATDEEGNARTWRWKPSRR